MRAIKRLKNRGFTLVELMIVVAIIGVLAALAIFGVRKYLASAKMSEAKNTLGAINRASVAAYERENLIAQILPDGQTSNTASHALCKSALPVPNAVPLGKKYQPQTGPGLDYNGGNKTDGWTCLKFGMSEPHYYQYGYEYKAKALGINGVAMSAPENWTTGAAGDLDGNGKKSGFQTGGEIRNGQPVVMTTLYEEDPEELSPLDGSSSHAGPGSRSGLFAICRLDARP